MIHVVPLNLKPFSAQPKVLSRPCNVYLSLNPITSTRKFQRFWPFDKTSCDSCRHWKAVEVFGTRFGVTATILSILVALILKLLFQKGTKLQALNPKP